MNNRFLNTEKTMAYVDGMSIPMGHRFWVEHVEPIIDTLEDHVEYVPDYAELRSSAYKAESDHLFFAGQYDNDLTKWRDRVAEIKRRHPKVV